MKPIKISKNLPSKKLYKLSYFRFLSNQADDPSEAMRAIRRYGTAALVGRGVTKKASFIVLTRRNPNFIETSAACTLPKRSDYWLYMSKSGTWLLTPDSFGKSDVLIKGTSYPIGTRFNAYPLKRLKGFVDIVYVAHDPLRQSVTVQDGRTVTLDPSEVII